MKYIGNIKVSDIDLADLIGPFDMRTEPPTRNGVYVTQHYAYPITFQAYSGIFWGMYAFNSYEADESIHKPSRYQEGKWWGLKEKNL